MTCGPNDTNLSTTFTPHYFVNDTSWKAWFPTASESLRISNNHTTVEKKENNHRNVVRRGGGRIQKQVQGWRCATQVFWLTTVMSTTSIEFDRGSGMVVATRKVIGTNIRKRTHLVQSEIKAQHTTLNEWQHGDASIAWTASDWHQLLFFDAVVCDTIIL